MGGGAGRSPGSCASCDGTAATQGGTAWTDVALRAWRVVRRRGGANAKLVDTIAASTIARMIAQLILFVDAIRSMTQAVIESTA